MNIKEPYVQKEPARVLLKYSEPQSDVLETTADRVLFLAGVGSGKSEVIGVKSMDFIINNPEMIGIICANTYGQLNKSTLKRVFNVWEERFGLKRGVHYVVDCQPLENFKTFGAQMQNYKNVISFQNGAMVFVASLDNWEAIDGVEIGWAMLDETKDTKEEAVKACIIQRLRQKGMYLNTKTNTISKTMKPDVDKNGEPIYKGYNPLYIFTSPAKTKWLSDWFHIDEHADEIQKVIFSETDYFRKRTGRQLVIISSTFHNKHNLPTGYIEGMIEDLGGDQGLIDMQIYACPFGKTGGEFITQFKRMQHVKAFEIWPDEAIHVSFDFNYSPYMTATCYQVKFIEETQRYLLRVFDEFCLPNPKNNCEDLSQAIIDTYGDLLKNGFFYYGDFSGTNSDPMIREFKHKYQVIEKYFLPWMTNRSRRVIVNQPIVRRKNFVNKLLRGSFNVDIEIHKRCVELIADFEFCKEGPDGGKLKETEEIRGVICQPRGHALDSFEYEVTSMFNTLFNR